MQITHIEAIPYLVPLRRIAHFASGARDRADHVLVRVHTDEGLIGQAEAQPRPYTYGETQASIVAAIGDHLGPSVAGLDPIATERIAERTAALAGNAVARGAIDLAVWDLVGQILDRPCRELLGGYARDVAAAHMISQASPAAMAAEAVEYAERWGIASFKVKVGRDVDIDIAATTAIRDALPDAELYLDANRGWDEAAALRAADALIPLGIRSIEEPVPVDDRATRRRLADRWPVPLVGDESCTSLAAAAREIDGGTVGTVSVKVARTGFTDSRRILDLCLGLRVPVTIGSQYEGAVGAIATAAFAPAFAATAGRPAEVMNYTDLADDLLAFAPDVRDGRIVPPDGPGLGIVIDEEKLAHYRVDAPTASAVA